MPSKSASQARLMAAAAHTPGGYGGVPQSVGREFNEADKAKHAKRPAGRKLSGMPERIDKKHERAETPATERREHLAKRGLISARQRAKNAP